MTGLILHNYFRSSTSTRLRAALNLKGVTYDYISHHLRKGEHRSPDYLAINPQGLVPAVVLPDGHVLTQSLAIIEYLDETVPEPPLLPETAVDRARVRALAYAIACEVHPSTICGSWPTSSRTSVPMTKRRWPGSGIGSMRLSSRSKRCWRKTREPVVSVTAISRGLLMCASMRRCSTIAASTSTWRPIQRSFVFLRRARRCHNSCGLRPKASPMRNDAGGRFRFMMQGVSVLASSGRRHHIAPVATSAWSTKP